MCQSNPRWMFLKKEINNYCVRDASSQCGAYHDKFFKLNQNIEICVSFESLNLESQNLWFNSQHLVSSIVYLWEQEKIFYTYSAFPFLFLLSIMYSMILLMLKNLILKIPSPLYDLIKQLCTNKIHGLITTKTKWICRICYETPCKTLLSLSVIQ